MTYLIVGASSDIGKALIKKINSEAKGSNEKPVVIGHYRSSKDELEIIGNESTNIELKLVKADLSCEQEVSAFVDKIKEYSENVDKISFLPAAAFDYMRMKSLDIEKLKLEMEISVYSFLKIMQAFLPDMKKSEGSRVVGLLTKYVTDNMPPKFMTDYVVTKYALLGAIKSMASEYGGGKLIVAGLAPDMINTKFLNNIDDRIKELTAMNMKDGRLLEPSEVADEIYRLFTSDDIENGQIYEM